MEHGRGARAVDVQGARVVERLLVVEEELLGRRYAGGGLDERLDILLPEGARGGGWGEGGGGCG